MMSLVEVFRQQMASQHGVSDYVDYLSASEGITAIATAIIAGATIWYVVVSVGILRAITKQVGEMEKQRLIMEGQLRQAEIAATAADKSAQALMDGERAWLLIEDLGIAEGFDPIAQAMHTAGTGPVTSPPWMEYPLVTFSIRNFGKTPGRIIDIESRIEMGNSRDAPPHPADVYEPGTLKHVMALMTGNTVPVEERIVPQGKSREEEVKKAHLMVSSFSAEQLTRIKNDADFLWAYGVVRYKDVYDRGHETKFCYRYVVPPEVPEAHFCLRGPEAYNRAT